MKSRKEDIRLMDTVICRTPVFGFNENIEQCWPFLKGIIKESSPQFSQVIDGTGHAQINSANEKVAFSIWKYFNRARYRATPFGNFAAVSLVPVSSGKVTPPLIINKKMDSLYYTDWAEKDVYLQNLKKLVAASEYFRANATWYRVGSEVRYIKRIDTQFELAAVTDFPELSALLNACKSKLTRSEIYELMGNEFKIDKKVIDDMLYQLVGCQLLLTNKQPNITGEDYFKRIQLNQLSTSINYIIAERQVKSGGFDISITRNLSEYLFFMKDFTPTYKNENLTTFAQKFSKKFDQKAMPLGIAIDPEAGIGYGNMAQELLDPELSSVLRNLANKKNTATQFSYTPQHRFLLNKLMKGQTICLEEFEKTNSGDNVSALPNTFSVMFSSFDGSPVIENAGGCTANSLLGRFTLGNEQAEDLGKSITAIEEKANPGVMFFDIAYQAEKRVDNVNRRQQLYEYELPILTWSCSEVPLSLDDIFVIVRNGEIILWSERHNKRLVPRLASAYNYTRSDLAVYRFLCDLQHQNLKTDLTLNLQQFFPGLDHYPRVMYKSIIVSAEMWRLDPKALFPAGSSKTKNMDALREWFQLNNVNSHFKCGNGDQTLCFNPGNAQDMDAFITFCNQSTAQDIYIKEASINEADMIADEQGNKYIPQYIANFFHEQCIYKSVDLSAMANPKGPIVKNTYYPGDEWLYFEIYCHPLRSNQVLNECINELISQYKHLLQKWFFIRYADPAYHIRLRLQLVDVSMANMVMDALRLIIEPLCADGLVSDIQVKTYHRETERYGHERIELVEDFFCHDSQYVLRMLSKGKTPYQLYPLTLQWMNDLFELAIEDISHRMELVKTITDNFSREFAIGNEDYKAINRLFEKLKTEQGNYGSPGKQKFSKQYSEAFAKVINRCITPSEKAGMPADLVHMHINRIFYTDQRMHEAILYQYLLKLIKTREFHPVEKPELLSAL